MADLNLTRVEAQRRARLLTVQRYDVDLDLTVGPETFRSRTRVDFDAAAGAQTFIDAVTRTVHAIELNGRALDPASASDGYRIHLTELQEHNTLVVDADAIYSTT